MTDSEIREVCLLWPAWRVTVEYVSCEKNPCAADPQSIYGAACAAGDRLAARFYGGGYCESLDEAVGVVEEVLAMARDGRRPRQPREVGFTARNIGGWLS